MPYEKNDEDKEIDRRTN